MCTSTPPAPGQTTAGPPGDSSIATSPAPPASAPASVTHADADVRAASSSRIASTSEPHSCSTSRSSTCTGTPSAPPSRLDDRKFSPHARPRSQMPTFASIPASVNVVNHRPRSSTVQSTREAARSGCQSQFCAIVARAPSSRPISEHSPSPPSSSVRALTAHSSAGSTSAPSAIPASSSPSAGHEAATLAPTRAPSRSSSASPSPAASHSIRR